MSMVAVSAALVGTPAGFQKAGVDHTPEWLTIDPCQT
jgi:hypothetical protein